MSLWINLPSCSPTYFSKLIHCKNYPKIWDTSVIFENLPKEHKSIAFTLGLCSHKLWFFKSCHAKYVGNVVVQLNIIFDVNSLNFPVRISSNSFFAFV
jgi:hypothetical protein